MFTPKSKRLMALERLRIYSNYLDTQGCLLKERWEVHWTRNGRSAGRLHGRTLSETEIVISYAVLRKKGEGEEVKQTIGVTYTPLHYGGDKAWFLCECGKRVGVLFFTGRRFLCRHCGGVKYASQNEGELARTDAKMCHMVQKMRERDPEISFPDEKPKRMRWATFNRLTDAYEELAERRNELIAKRCGRIRT